MIGMVDRCTQCGSVEAGGSVGAMKCTGPGANV